MLRAPVPADTRVAAGSASPRLGRADDLYIASLTLDTDAELAREGTLRRWRKLDTSGGDPTSKLQRKG